MMREINFVNDYISFSEPTNMLDMKAIIWLENYLQVSRPLTV